MFLASALAGAALLLPNPVPTIPVELTFPARAAAEPFTGRVFVVATKAANDGPPRGVSWFSPQPFFAQDVVGWKPGTPLTFEPKFAHPRSWAGLGREKWHLQAVMDRDQGGPNCLTAAGNLYSAAAVFDPAKPGPVKLTLDRVIPERRAESTDRIAFVEIESKLLSRFHGKPMKLRARVVLPKSFAQGDRKYPVVYSIPGFSGTHTGRHVFEGSPDVGGTEMLLVVLDPSCRTGHHVFADSANNGPCGRALTEELIPHIEATYRGLAQPAGRFLTGGSSGGWSSLWLQITYPDFFGGVWSIAPDPVDFRDFQRINIYAAGENMFVDRSGEPRPLARNGERVLLRYKPFSDMEVVMGRGGQLQSFEAVFSPRGKDGRPLQLWDRGTGAIDPAVAAAWRRYDIRLILEANWTTLGPKLAGKLHVWTGDLDTFYLDGAARLLKASLAKLGSDAVVELVPGRNHGNVLDAPLRKRMAAEMAAAARRVR